jgi:predicted DNA-binding protein
MNEKPISISWRNMARIYIEPYSIMITPAVKARLKALKAFHNVETSELVREAIDKAIADKEVELTISSEKIVAVMTLPVSGKKL